MIRRIRLLWAAILLVPAALAAQAPATVGSATPEAAIQRLLKAVADSNLSDLADAWGTPAGPASKVKPREWERRVAVIQAYMRGGTYRLLGTDQTVQAVNGRRTILVEMRRDKCLKQFPIVTSQLRDQSWLVTGVDITAIGVPGKQCDDV